MTRSNPQSIRQDELVAFLSNPDAGTYRVLTVDRYGRCGIVPMPDDGVTPPMPARASDLVQVPA